MSGEADIPRGVASGAAPQPATLLVVCEPPGESGGSSSAALLAEGARVAGGLGVEVRSVTWEAAPDIDPQSLAAAVVDAVRRTRPAAVLFADTDTGRGLAPLVAHRLGSGAVMGCSDVLVQRTLVFVKPVYGGWLEREIEPAAGSVPIVTLDVAGLPEPPPESVAGPAPAEVLCPEAGAPAVRRVDLAPPDPRTVDLTDARRIVTAGSGGASEHLLAAVHELAELLEGSVGATRPVVDDGGLPKERLIGQTGRTVTPDLYLALGVSGSPHHMAGVRDAERVLSVNRDVRAPIFQFSDVGYVADLEVVLPALVQKIKEWRDDVG